MRALGYRLLYQRLRDGQARSGAWQRTISLPRGPGDVGKVYAVAISPGGGLIAAGGRTSSPGENEKIYLFERQSGKLLSRITGLPGPTAHLVFSPDSRYLVAMLGGLGSQH